jgi:hypothetical protein
MLRLCRALENGAGEEAKGDGDVKVHTVVREAKGEAQVTKDVKLDAAEGNICQAPPEELLRRLEHQLLERHALLLHRPELALVLALKPRQL